MPCLPANTFTGAPGTGKGTLCTHLARVHNLVHFSVGDNLRTYMKQTDIRHSRTASSRSSTGKAS